MAEKNFKVGINLNESDLINAGKVGIGTTSPGALLDVRGAAVFNEGGSSVDFRVESNGRTHMFFVDGSANRIGINHSTPDAEISFKSAFNDNTTAMYWRNSSNVELLRVFADGRNLFGGASSLSTNNGAILANHLSGYPVTGNGDNFNIAASRRGSSGPQWHKMGVMTVKNGFGAVPGGDLAVEAGSISTNSTSATRGGHLFLRSGRSGYFNTNFADSNVYIQTALNPGSNGRAATWGTAIFADNTQQVGIGGVTSPTEDLDVSANARFRTIGSGTSAGALHYTSNGTLTTNTSDIRLKENITVLEGSLEKIQNLRGVNFEWKEDKEQGIKTGFIAQEVAEVIPEVAFTNPVDGMMGIHYQDIIPHLVESIKEQQAQISELKDELAVLKKQIKQ